ncbi:type II toxin-antitoxin system Phd/YefM family antitoxin [Candidatus Berkelbacteria bacterium]|nr:type II toxin-antitoxin system Phd/YefM family antitoxin [Candidatus Berkelbacteria bacterium]
MAQYVTMTDLRFKMKKIVKEVLESGKPLTVTRHGRKLVRVVPVRRQKKVK